MHFPLQWSYFQPTILLVYQKVPGPPIFGQKNKHREANKESPVKKRKTYKDTVLGEGCSQVASCGRKSTEVPEPPQPPLDGVDPLHTGCVEKVTVIREYFRKTQLS